MAHASAPHPPIHVQYIKSSEEPRPYCGPYHSSSKSSNTTRMYALFVAVPLVSPVESTDCARATPCAAFVLIISFVSSTVVAFEVRQARIGLVASTRRTDEDLLCFDLVVHLFGSSVRFRVMYVR